MISFSLAEYRSSTFLMYLSWIVYTSPPASFSPSPSIPRRWEENCDDMLKSFFSFGVLLLCIGMSRLTQDNPERNLVAQFSESLYSVLCGVFILLLQFGTMERA